MPVLRVSIGLAEFLAVLALVMTTPIAAQDQPDRGVLQLSVVDARTDAPLAYAVVGIAQANVERFTDGRGRLAVPALSPGVYQVTVRRLGFVPYRVQVSVTPGAPTVLEVRMSRVPQQLTRVRVVAASYCTSPGAPDAVRDPEVFTLVSLLRENADRYRLLAYQYPFVSMHARALGEVRDDALFIQNVDIQPIPSKTRVEYRAGSVVRRRGNQYSMGLPTILDLADDGFARTHCFFYGGATPQTTVTGEETWYRLDVRADDKMDTPDVHGAFYLDSATSQLRKMDLELSRPDKLPRQLATIATVHVSTGFVEIASGLSVIQTVCAVTRLRPSDKAADSASRAVLPTELQQLTSYVFTTPPPDVPTKQSFEAPEWRSQTYMSRKAIWCEE
ncbi:MAG: carboxypeptidase regulatory-like domain-containing protein [Gemmatimonadaceae bacterium]|nr:carboxypeptidase regulatory-like domain-containing protein [Gemmatimonadaceae bacterium]